MKYLLLLLPLFSFSQEIPIGVRISNVWTFSTKILSEAQSGMDSIASAQSKVFEHTYDSVRYQNDSVISLFTHKGKDVYTDRMFVWYNDDTLWTAPDPMKEACSTTCTYYSCVGGCLKTVNCDCSCDGYCVGSNLGVMMDMPVGEMCRQRILVYNGHIIPKD